MSPAWPKLTGDWTVANPALGSFGTLETTSAPKVVIAMSRSGRIQAYRTAAAPCSTASWPRFHHDNANSGDLERDAVSPGRPAEPSVAAGALRFTAPGDDLLCGAGAAYEYRTSDAPITPANFAAADPLAIAGAPAAAGTAESKQLPAAGVKRYVAVRARDDQGNVGRPAVVDRTPPPPPTQTPDPRVTPTATPAATPAATPTPSSTEATPTPQPQSAATPAPTAGPGPSRPPFVPGTTGESPTPSIIRAARCARRLGHVGVGQSARRARRAAPYRIRVRAGLYHVSPNSRTYFLTRSGSVAAILRSARGTRPKARTIERALLDCMRRRR